MPRRSRRSATIAATETRSLSFSRGVRFIDNPGASNVPTARQARRQSQRRRAKMASEIGITLAQRGGVGGEPPHNDEPGDHGCAGLYSPSAAQNGSGRGEKVARLPPGRQHEHCGKRRRPAEASRVVDNAPHIAAEVERVSPDKLVFPPNLPDLVE